MNSILSYFYLQEWKSFASLPITFLVPVNSLFELLNNCFKHQSQDWTDLQTHSLLATDVCSSSSMHKNIKVIPRVAGIFPNETSIICLPKERLYMNSEDTQ